MTETGNRWRAQHGRAARASGLSRRSVLVGVGGIGALAVGWTMWPRAHVTNLTAADGESLFNAYLKIHRDGQIVIIVPQTEMGQGITTLIPQIMADELGTDWRTIAVESAPINPVYTNVVAIDDDSDAFTPRALVPDAVADARRWARREFAIRHAMMLTVGSTGMRMFEGPCRIAAAQARAALMMAAAQRWDADWTQCDTKDGFVTLGEKKIRFGDLAADAAAMIPPDEPVFRDTGTDSLYGQELTRLDLPSKVDGTANYAGDVRLPGLAFAAIRQGPLGRTRLRGINRETGRASPDLLDIVQHDRWFAVVARNWWAANRALDAFAPTFETEGPPISSEGIDRALQTAIAGDGWRVARRGNGDRALTGAGVIHADYRIAPALHAPIETRTATASVETGRCRVWVATQAPAQCRRAVARAMGLNDAAVTLIPMPAGGSFDIALEHDVAVQAALIARAVKRPVQLCWSRAEEILRDLPRPPALARLSGRLDANGALDSLRVRLAVPPVNHEVRDRLLNAVPAAEAQARARGRIDAGALAGAMPPYRIPHVAVDHCPADIGLPVGRWRGHAASYTIFCVETFVDEMAEIAGSDPLSFRMMMLSGAPELAQCLLRATASGGWEGGDAGSMQGIACASMAGSHIALLASARMTERGLQVDRMTAVVECGRVPNPAIARQQIEGGLIFGLAAAVGATVNYDRGLASARRLGQLGLPRLAQSPAISVELIDSDREPGGVEEIGVVVAAPAIANALFAATGQRIRRLPLARSGDDGTTAFDQRDDRVDNRDKENATQAERDDGVDGGAADEGMNDRDSDTGARMVGGKRRAAP